MSPSSAISATSRSTALFDGRMLGQAFGNIIKNAVEAIEAVASRCRSRRAQDDGALAAERDVGRFVVDVIDNGKGLPTENRHRILEPYMTMREKGTGLGLAIVKKIIEDHGGQLELHDAPADFDHGQGAMIRDHLAASRTERRHCKTDRTRKIPMAADILVVDDEEDIREIVSGILSDEGHETRTAFDSDSALAAISDRVPRLVFLDIWMQGSRLDGLALARRDQEPLSGPAGRDDFRPRQYRDGGFGDPPRRL